MKYLLPFFQWLLGLSVLVASFAVLTLTPIGSLFFLIASFIILPPTNSRLNNITKDKLNRFSSVILSLLLLICGLFFLNKYNTEFFSLNRDDILIEIEQNISEKDYLSAISIAQRYLLVNDDELNYLHDLAKEKQQVLESEERLRQYVEGVVQKAREHHEQVAQTRIKDQNEIDDKRKSEISRQFSSWNGSHRNLVSHIKRQMNDPSSFEHVETVYWDKGNHLIVRTTFRGKNAFGGVVLNSVTAKVSLDGKVRPCK